MIGFGVGYLTLVPPAGSADITPIRVAKLQEVSLDLSYSTKELKSNKIFADDVARASAKISGKAKSADVKARALASLLTGATSSAGQLVPQMDQGTGVIASAQYDTGVTLANFDEDFGVDDETGKPMKKVTSAPAAGEYQCDTTTGPNVLYKFNAAANGKVYLVNFSKKDSTAGTTVSLTNQLMGLAVKYKAMLQNVYNGNTFTMKLRAVVIPKLAFALKNEDYTIQDLDFEAQADSTGAVLDASFTS